MSEACDSKYETQFTLLLTSRCCGLSMPTIKQALEEITHIVQDGMDAIAQQSIHDHTPRQTANFMRPDTYPESDLLRFTTYNRSDDKAPLHYSRLPPFWTRTVNSMHIRFCLCPIPFLLCNMAQAHHFSRLSHAFVSEYTTRYYSAHSG